MGQSSISVTVIVPVAQNHTKNLQTAFATQSENEKTNHCNVPIQHQEVFHMRSSEEALLDSCCSANVVERQWKDTFIDAISDEDKTDVRHLKGCNCPAD